eukprot:TRINITY_DN3686_c0_g1_i1.p1 TRINITY_DN3686_c0_g1~~TRINITY_DN3686_c0_g1_i1.p1  ORF type:complete len:116 (+),score=21.28 TRINITY_DN3686_c0_g1_i1:301-648(+)
MLMHTEQYDWFQLESDLGWVKPPFNHSQGESEYVEMFRHSFRSTLLNKVKHPSAVWSAACFAHCFTEDPYEFTKLPVQGVTISDALGDWFFHDKPTFVMDNCQGFNCTQGCVTMG